MNHAHLHARHQQSRRLDRKTGHWRPAGASTVMLEAMLKALARQATRSTPEYAGIAEIGAAVAGTVEIAAEIGIAIATITVITAITTVTAKTRGVCRKQRRLK